MPHVEILEDILENLQGQVERKDNEQVELHFTHYLHRETLKSRERQKKGQEPLPPRRSYETMLMQGESLLL